MVHQAKRRQAHGHVFVGVAQQLDESMEVAVLVQDAASAVPAVEDVVAVAAHGNSQGTSHVRHSGAARWDRQPKSAGSPWGLPPRAPTNPYVPN